jgi:hypothetical protein
MEEIDIEIPVDDFTLFLNINPIDQAYNWLKENAIGFEDAVDDYDVVEPPLIEVIEEVEPNE